MKLAEFLGERFDPADHKSKLEDVVKRVLDDLMAQSVRGSGRSHEYRSTEGIQHQAEEMLKDAGLPPEDVMLGVEMIMQRIERQK